MNLSNSMNLPSHFALCCFLAAAMPTIPVDKKQTVSRVAYAGDLAPFLQGHLIAHGGTNAALHSFPSVQVTGRWLAQYDEGGVQIFFQGDKFAEIQGLLSQWYGRKPDFGPGGGTSPRNGSMEGMVTYTMKNMGCAATCALAGEDFFFGEGHSAMNKMTQVIVLRVKQKAGLSDGALKP